MMFSKCCTQYFSKFGKLSSDHRTRKSQISFQSQRRSMPKNAQTIAQMHSFHMLTSTLKIFQARFQQYVNQELQMYKLGLEKAEETEIKLPKFAVS